MEDTNENEQNQDENREETSNSRTTAQTRFGQNLWLEVERWRRHQTSVKSQDMEGPVESPHTSTDTVHTDANCGPSSTKKARFSWQVKKSSRNEDLSSETKEVASGSQTQDGDTKLLANNCGLQSKTQTTENEAISSLQSSRGKSHDKVELNATHDKDSVGAEHDASKNSGEKRPLKRKFNDSPRSDNLKDSPIGDNHLSPKKNQITQPLYLDRWQKKHIAKAVVDNAVNRTLTDLGLSPDSDFNQFAAQSRNVEQEGVSTVIQSRGLCRSTLQAADIFERLGPTVDEFNDATENLSFNGMFHMLGSLDYNPLQPPPTLRNENGANAQMLTCNGLDSKSHKANEEKVCQAKGSEMCHKQSHKDKDLCEVSTQNVETQPSVVINEALSVVIADRGLVLK